MIRARTPAQPRIALVPAGNERLAIACRRALGYGIYNYKTIQSILENKMDSYEDSLFADELLMPSHDNIRGEDYYQ